MKVRLIKKRSIEDFSFRNAKSRVGLKLWLALLKKAEWSVPGDIVKTFVSADLLGRGSERVVFDISGNHYRMICKYHFGDTNVILFIKWIGTHAEYTKLCKDNKQFSVNNY